jgi:hypothetical protein
LELDTPTISIINPAAAAAAVAVTAHRHRRVVGSGIKLLERK